MANYVASYDLHNQRHYQGVWAKLESLGATRLLESLWVLTTPLSAVEIRDQLKSVADSDDSIAVIELKAGCNWAAERAKTPGVSWLRQNILA